MAMEIIEPGLLTTVQDMEGLAAVHWDIPQMEPAINIP